MYYIILCYCMCVYVCVCVCTCACVVCRCCTFKCYNYVFYIYNVIIYAVVCVVSGCYLRSYGVLRDSRIPREVPSQIWNPKKEVAKVTRNHSLFTSDVLHDYVDAQHQPNPQVTVDLQRCLASHYGAYHPCHIHHNTSLVLWE